jgi:polar amino acid transport system ATP-binding protein
MMFPIIQCSRVSKSYGETRILEDFDLEVSAGEKLAIIGPSGSGKSTILRLLMGLETYQSGRITIAGKLLPSESEPRRRRATHGHDVGMVFQQFNLFPHMTALENVVEAPIRVLKMSSADGRKRARELFRKVGLSGRDDAYPAQLSGGEQQRVAIGRALANHPSLLLADEPTGNLDPKTASGVFEALLALVHAEGLAALVATHNAELAQRMDRSLILHEGELLEGGRHVAAL